MFALPSAGYRLAAESLRTTQVVMQRWSCTTVVLRGIDECAAQFRSELHEHVLINEKPLGPAHREDAAAQLDEVHTDRATPGGKTARRPGAARARAR